MNQHAAPAVEDNSYPSRIVRFYLTRVLGQGASGRVHLGHDPVIGRDVAIKTLLPNLPARERRRHAECLINEARAAGRLCHPHIVAIYEAGDDGEQAYIAMEYLQGQSLDRILASGRRFRPEEVASIGCKLADALDHAHRRQVVHRDIKPGNVFLVADDQPKLVDFGIARAPKRIGEVEQPLPHTIFRPHQPLGTPNYMSPEQAQGTPADARSDIYALGVLLCEMLAGRSPFHGCNATRFSEQAGHEASPALHTMKPGVPAQLARVVAKAMHKRPEKRYQDAHRMAQDLKRYLLLERRERRRRMVSGDAGDKQPGASARRPLLYGTITAVAAVSVILLLIE